MLALQATAEKVRAAPSPPGRIVTLYEARIDIAGGTGVVYSFAPLYHPAIDGRGNPVAVLAPAGWHMRPDGLYGCGHSGGLTAFGVATFARLKLAGFRFARESGG